MTAKKSELPEWLSVGFSGHRDIRNPAAVATKIGEVFDKLAEEYGSLAAVSSAARGADTLFLEEAAKRKLPTRVILPFDRKKFGESFSPGEWNRVLPHIEHLRQVEEIFASGDDAYMEAGERTIEQADVVLVVWDGKKAAGSGGTGDAVEYAGLMGKPIIHIHPDTLKVTPGKFDFWPSLKKSAAFTDKPRAVLEKHLDAGDFTAKRNAWWARMLALILVIIHLVASAIGMSIPVFNIDGRTEVVVVAGLELLLLGLAMVLAFVHHGRHSEWLRERIQMEICRSFNATWELRGLSGSFALTAIQGYESFANNLRTLRVQDETAAANWTEIRERYRHDRVCDQMRYFTNKAAQAKRRHHVLQAVAKTSTTGAALMTAVVLGMELGETEGTIFHIVKYLSLVLPLFSAAFFSIILTNEHGRRAERYDDMVNYLEQAARRLKAAKSASTLVRIAAETEEVLLREVIEWHSFTRFTGKLH